MQRKTRDLVLAGLFIALGILIPMVFHVFGQAAGQVFLPMHIPVLLAGFFLLPGYAAVVGLVTPLLSSVLTGMPPLYPMAPLMAVELCVYGLAASLVYRWLAEKDIKKIVKIVISLVAAMVVGRAAAGLGVWAMVGLFSARMPSPIDYISGGVVTGLPGIVIQIVIIPVIVLAVGAMGRRDREGER